MDCSGFTRWVYRIAYGRDVLGNGNTDMQVARMPVSAVRDRLGYYRL